MKNFRLIYVFIMSVIFLIPLQAKPETKDMSKIAVMLPFTSAFNSIAIEQQNAINLLAKQHPEYQLIYLDGKGDADSAISAFNSLLTSDEPPFALISCASWVATALHPLAADAGIFHIVIGSANFTRTKPGHTVRFTLDDHQEEQQLANYLNAFDRIAIYNMDNSYGDGWKAIIQKNMQNKVVEAISYDPENKDFRQDLKRIHEKEPDALVLLSAGNAAIIAQEARQLGIKAQLVGTRPIERPELLEAAEYTNGLIYTYPSYNRNHPMIAEYTTRYGYAPTIFGIEAYDAFNSLVTAVAAGNINTDPLFNWYKDRTYNGALGEVHFDSTGDAHYPYMYKEVANGHFIAADFQYSLLLNNAKHEILTAFEHMSATIEASAAKLTEAGLQGDKTHVILHELYNQVHYAFDVVTVDPDGIIRDVYPTQYDEVIGKDISSQPQIIKLHKTKKPVVSEAIQTVEEFLGIDLEQPVFSRSNTFMGSVSILTSPDFFNQVISQKVSNFPVEFWIMQKDGTIVFDDNPEEIGQNVFTDEIYASHQSLVDIAKVMINKESGKGEYSFLDTTLNNAIEKKILWATLNMHGTEFILALAYKKGDF